MESSVNIAIKAVGEAQDVYNALTERIKAIDTEYEEVSEKRRVAGYALTDAKDELIKVSLIEFDELKLQERLNKSATYGKELPGER